MRHFFQRSKRSRERGFGLIEIMIAVGILGLVGSAVVSLFTNHLKSNNTNRFRAQTEVITNEIRALLSSEEACAHTFMPSVLDGSTNAPAAAIKDKDGSSKFITGNRYENFTLQNAVLKDYAHVSGTTGNARLELLLAASDNSVVGPPILTRSINIRTQRDGGNNMTECIATSEMSDGLWQRDSSSINDIFYVGGAVQVGSNTDGLVADGLGPRLIIAGNTNNNSDLIFLQREAWASNRTSLRISVGDDAHSGVAMSDAIQMGATEFSTGNWVPMVHLDTGTSGLGIGTTTPQARLDVAGEVKVSDTGLACSAATEGTMKYNHTLKRMEYCGGATLAWRTLVPAIVAGCNCIPTYAGGSSCGTTGAHTWTCWGGASVDNPPIMVCPAGSSWKVTGNGIGGPTGFICLTD